MNNSDTLDYHLEQSAALGLSPSQYLARHPEVDDELGALLLLTQQLRIVVRPCPPLSAEAQQQLFQHITAKEPPAPASAPSHFFIPGFSRLEAIRYIGAHGLSFLWRIHKAPGVGYAALFDLVVLAMRALRRLEMYSSFR
jgi:hypothetical protein